jgi:hypothetical protein
LKRYKDEPVGSFGERLCQEAEKAYEGEDFESKLIQQIVIDIFINGIQNIVIEKAIIRANPATVVRAIEIACQEEKVTARLNNRTGRRWETKPSYNNTREEESMEIGQVRNRFQKSYFTQQYNRPGRPRIGNVFDKSQAQKSNPFHNTGRFQDQRSKPIHKSGHLNW